MNDDLEQSAILDDGRSQDRTGFSYHLPGFAKPREIEIFREAVVEEAHIRARRSHGKGG